jgi:nickel-dependent lactate racemase
MRVKLAYGRAGLWIDLPDTVPVTVIEPRGVAGLGDEPAAIAAALSAPVRAPPLRELVRPGDSVATVFSDLTRPMPNERMRPVLLAELAKAGVRDGHIVLINALGTHRPQTREELEQIS